MGEGRERERGREKEGEREICKRLEVDGEETNPSQPIFRQHTERAALEIQIIKTVKTVKREKKRGKRG